MSKMELKPQLKQVQHLSPQMLQSMKILQMDTQELHDYVERELEENPVLEKEAKQPATQPTILIQYGRNGRKSVSTHDYFLDDDVSTLSVQGLSTEKFLLDQLERLKLPEHMKSVCGYLVQMLDENGYLSHEERLAAEEIGIPKECIDEAVLILQGLEPAGIAARDLRECLLLQLNRTTSQGDLPRKIVEKYLEELSQKRWHYIAQQLQITEEEVRRAADAIKKLNPRPGYCETEQCVPEYIIPDIVIKEQDETLEAVLNESYLPRIYVNEYYEELYQTATDEETKTFLRERIRRAKTVIDSLERRYHTLQACADLILRMQSDFLRGNTPYLVPITQKQAAQQLGMHESTLGRCIRGKYLQCRIGTFSMQYFFSHSVGEGDCSEQAVQMAMQELIRKEPPEKPYSDRQLAEMLAKQGFAVARRTIAKYRQQLRIPPAYGRKKG